MYSTHCLHLRVHKRVGVFAEKLHYLSSDSQNHKIMWRIALHWLCNCFWKEVGVRNLSWCKGGLFCLVSRRVEWRGVVCLEMWSTFPPLFLMYILSCALLLYTFSTLARHTGSDEREVIGQLMQRISLHLMRSNAGMITSRRPEADFLPPELDGVEWTISISQQLRCK